MDTSIGQLAGSDKSTSIDRTWRNTVDPGKRRATFGVPYPVLEISLEKSSDVRLNFPARFENGRTTVADRRIFVAASPLLIARSDFRTCKFHRFREKGISRIEGATFTSCTFDRCFLGGTLYRLARFEECTFVRCDFGMSEFLNCHFRLCTFVECTSEHVSFTATEIEPSAILRGMIAPHYNYQPPGDGDPLPADLASQWLIIRKELASQLLKSNGEIYHSDNCDAGLVELKRAELAARFDELRRKPLGTGIVSAAMEFSRCVLLWLILVATKGGTSVGRLLQIATVSILGYSVLLSVSKVTFQGKPCQLVNVNWPSIVEQVGRATSLFLAIGYTAFAGSTPAEVLLLTIGATAGLIWYALLAAVVIRRVYR